MTDEKKPKDKDAEELKKVPAGRVRGKIKCGSCSHTGDQAADDAAFNQKY